MDDGSGGMKRRRYRLWVVTAPVAAALVLAVLSGTHGLPTQFRPQLPFDVAIAHTLQANAHPLGASAHRLVANEHPLAANARGANDGVFLPGTVANQAERVGTPTYSALGRDATRTLTHSWYAGDGRWRTCALASCSTTRQDWGADSLAGALYLRWAATHDPRLGAFFRRLAPVLPRHVSCRGSACTAWSDVPEWDAVAALRAYEVSREPIAIERAVIAYESVDASPGFVGGACAGVRFQHPFGRAGGLKTLETDANAVKAGILLARYTGRLQYLRQAIARYRSIRKHFRDPLLPLYTVYVLDDGHSCKQIPHRFFASVNGLMIWSGLALANATGDRNYLDDARSTANAVEEDLTDSRGIFIDLQAENDVVEPLVEAMDALARRGDARARHWIARNAGAAFAARGADGSYGRFFDGPPPGGVATAWQTSGALALEIEAAALFPDERPKNARVWTGAGWVSERVDRFPGQLEFVGDGIALVGTLGQRCCESGHARVFVDGRETVSGTGIWQNKSSSGRALPGTVLFAWQWPHSGRHKLHFEPGTSNAKEGDGYLHLTGYLLHAPQAVTLEDPVPRRAVTSANR